jgi:GcrA cell cycle regulator
MVWNDEAVAKLTKLYVKGLSSSEIAKELGTTRNAVIGKIDRSGLRLASKIEGFRKAVPKLPGPRPKERPRPRIKPVYYGIEEPAAPENMKGCTLMQLTDKTCRFPIGDPSEPGFHFCGSAVAGIDRVYCPHHTKIAYTTAAQRRAEAAAKESPNYGPQV